MLVKKISKTKFKGVVYNFSTPPFHNYFCESILVHNCHESSTVKGKHAPIENIKDILDSALPGMEVAIGGGDPFSHPQIQEIISWVFNRGMIPNVTIKDLHLNRSRRAICMARLAGMRGLGVSYTKNSRDTKFDREAEVYRLDGSQFSLWDNHNMSEDGFEYAIRDSRTVVHLILGIHDIGIIREQLFRGHVLLLGYKKYGRGVGFYDPAFDLKIEHTGYFLPGVMEEIRGKCGDHILSFDNLAIEQLHLKERLSPKIWEKQYMGADGQFTMYADACQMSYAIGSTCKRYPIKNMNLPEMFAHVRELSKENI